MMSFPIKLNDESTEDIHCYNNYNKTLDQNSERADTATIMNRYIESRRSASVIEKRDNLEVKGQQTITIEDITPELAAQIVRHYILPMFDRKQQQHVTKPINGGSLYAELKLTDKLEFELTKVRDQIKVYEISTEKLQSENIKLTKEVQNLNKKQISDNLKIEALKLFKLRQKQKWRSDAIAIQTESVKDDGLLQFVEQQQRKIEELTEQIHLSRNQSEVIQNQFIHQKTKLQMQQLSQDVMTDQTFLLFKALEKFPDNKNLMESHRYSIKLLRTDYSNLNQQYEKLQQDFTSILTERDYAQKMMREIQQKFENLEKRQISQFKELNNSVRDLQKLVDTRDEEINALSTQLINSEKQRQNAEKQVYKLMSRITRMKKTRFTSAIDASKTCKLCGADYLESENFNWSCRTHKSEFSGEIWWCCGKTNKDAQGCKFEKHQARTEADEKDEMTDAQNAALRNKQHCKCCKEVGHTADKCENDPNFHTTPGNIDQIELELQRISSIKDKKKMFANTVIQTTHFLKKCVIQPAIQEEINGKKDTKDKLKNIMSHPFKRGAMTFEDYNYNQFNSYILVENKDKEQLQSGGIFSKVTEDQLIRLDQQVAPYKHDSIPISQEEEQLALKQLKENIATQNSKISSSSDSQSSRDCNEETNQSDHLETIPDTVNKALEKQADEEQNIVYFNKKEIYETKNKQRQDIFKELVYLRQDSTRSILDTKIDIKEFTKEPEKKDNKKKSKMVKQVQLGPSKNELDELERLRDQELLEIERQMNENQDSVKKQRRIEREALIIQRDINEIIQIKKEKYQKIEDEKDSLSQNSHSIMSLVTPLLSQNENNFIK